MDNIDQIKNILATTQTNIPILSFVVGLSLATILGLVLAKVFINYANVMSNRKTMAFNLLVSLNYIFSNINCKIIISTVTWISRSIIYSKIS